jgi:hypothetical protein
MIKCVYKIFEDRNTRLGNVICLLSDGIIPLKNDKE